MGTIRVDERGMRLAQRLRAAREAAGLSQTQVASLLGVSRPTITWIESGERHVRSLELVDLCICYGVSAASILEGGSHETELSTS